MDELIKIRELSERYDVTTRTLRYYEAAGLIASVRGDDYAYRMYDAAAVKRLEQILILRRLNISVKDIRRVFSAPSYDALIGVLEKKVTDVDEEIALLYELREIVEDFIERIKEYDFHQEGDIRALYDKAKEIETRLGNVEYEGNPSPGKRLREISDRLAQAPDVRIVELPSGKAVSSGVGGADAWNKGGVLDRFGKWLGRQAEDHMDYAPRDYLWMDEEKGGMIWYYLLDEHTADTGDWEIVNFEGGLYATGIYRDQDGADHARVYGGIRAWVAESGIFALDERSGHVTMGHIITPPAVQKAMGYAQMELYVPIKVVRE